MNIENNDDDYEDEEIIVYADFGGKLHADEFNDKHLFAKVIGMDDEHPVIQVNSKTFKGTYKTVIGTNVFFTEDPDDTKQLNVDRNYEYSADKYYKYLTRSNTILKMDRIFIEKKQQNNTEQPGVPYSENPENFIVTKTYEEALNQFLPKGETFIRDFSKYENPSELKRMQKEAYDYIDVQHQQKQQKQHQKLHKLSTSITLASNLPLTGNSSGTTSTTPFVSSVKRERSVSLTEQKPEISQDKIHKDDIGDNDDICDNDDPDDPDDKNYVPGE